MNVTTPTSMEDDATDDHLNVSVEIDQTLPISSSPREFAHILETNMSTPPHKPALTSPPKLVRNQPGSNIWCQREDGVIVNQYGCVFPVPLRLFSDIDEETINTETEENNIRNLEEGIERGRVNVRPANVNMMALEEGIAQGHVNTMRGSR